MITNASPSLLSDETPSLSAAVAAGDGGWLKYEGDDASVAYS